MQVLGRGFPAERFAWETVEFGGRAATTEEWVTATAAAAEIPVVVSGTIE